MRFCNVLRENRRKRMSSEINKKRCRFPIGDPQASNFKFCEEIVTTVKFPYCDEHCRLCYINFDTIKDKPRIVDIRRKR